MSFLRLTLACLIMVLLVAGCEEGDEADFQEFVRNVLAFDANDDPVDINNQTFPNQLIEGEPLPVEAFLL